MKDKEWERLADEHSECRVFIEFADAYKELFEKWVLDQTISKVKTRR